MSAVRFQLHAVRRPIAHSPFPIALPLFGHFQACRLLRSVPNPCTRALRGEKRPCRGANAGPGPGPTLPDPNDVLHSCARMELTWARMEHSRARLELAWGRMEHSCARLVRTWGRMEHPCARLELAWGRMEHPCPRLDRAQGRMEHTRGICRPSRPHVSGRSGRTAIACEVPNQRLSPVGILRVGCGGFVEVDAAPRGLVCK